VVSRASAFECVAIIDLLHDQNKIDEVEFDNFLEKADELSRMFYKIISNLSALQTSKVRFSTSDFNITLSTPTKAE
jgi:hypothetical protein